MKIPFVGQAYESRSIPINSQKCVNWYTEIESPEARTPISLQTVSGQSEFINEGGGAINGLHFNTKLQLAFFVKNRVAAHVDINGVVTELGTIDGFGNVAISDNGDQVGFATGVNYHVWDDALGLTDVKIGGVDTLPARDITFQNGRFIIPATDTQQVYVTDVNDARTIGGLSFGEANASPDDAVGALSVNGRLWVWGENSYDTFYDAGILPFPYIRVDTGNSKGFGLAGTFAKTSQDAMAYWCSTDKRIYRSSGGLPQRISHFGVENSIRQYSTIADCEATEWTENGHRFVAFSFPSANATWVFDATSGMWHERASGVALNVWDSKFVTFAWEGRNITASRSEARLGLLNLDLFTEFGDSMKSLRTAPVVADGQRPVFTSRLELVMEVGRVERQAEEPKVLLSWSDDGGNTFGNKLFGSLGKIGEYYQRIVWFRLGRAVNRVYKLEITDDVRRTLLECDVEGDVGDI